jgi:Zn-finger nucleic acid-binding protein
MVSAEHPSQSGSADADVLVANCPGCGLTVRLPERTELDKCPACEAVLGVRANELDVELAVRSHLYSRG